MKKLNNIRTSLFALCLAFACLNACNDTNSTTHDIEGTEKDNDEGNVSNESRGYGTSNGYDDDSSTRMGDER